MFDVLVEKLRDLTAYRQGLVDLGCGTDEKFHAYVLCPYIGVDVQGGCRIKDDMRAVERWWPEDAAIDTAMFCDSLEHLTEVDALELIGKLKERVTRIIAFVPIGDHKQDHGPEHPQTHRSIWTAGMLADLGFDVTVWDDFHRWEAADKSTKAALGVWDAA